MDSNMSNETFRYLIWQILNENCTPVLGAGVSFDSKYEIETPEEYHKTEVMVKNIANKICSFCERISNSSINGNIYECCGKKCSIKNEVKNKQLSVLSQRLVWLMGENGNFQKRYEKLVSEVLKIEKFNYLIPTKAHYYLAFLAREGLITEVITTNYDTLLEKAYLKTFGFGNKKTNELLKLQNEKNTYNEVSYRKSIVVRIYDRKSFARFSSLKRFENKTVKIDDEPYVLKVYKINGCAFELINEDNNFYEKILLTSQQLQDWRERQWAADLFRYKLRSTTLLFIGYGSDEPQVLHTMQKVFEESKNDFTDNEGIEADRNDKNNESYEGKNKKNIFREYSNIPIISVFEEEPSFVHKYIARSFCESVNKNAEWGKLILNYKNMLKNSDKKELPADILMEKIYLKVFKKLLIEALEYSSHEANASFTAFIPRAQYILKEIERKIDDEELKQLPFISEEKESSNYPLPFIIKLFSSANGKKDVYFSIRYNKEGYAELLFILYVVSGGDWNKVKFYKNKIEIDGKCLYFSFNGKNIGSIKSSKSDEKNKKEKDKESEECGNMVVFLLGNYSIHNISSFSRIINKRDNKIKRNKVFFITWRDVFSDVKDYENISFKEIEKKLKKAISMPRKYAARERKSIRKRLVKIEVG